MKAPLTIFVMQSAHTDIGYTHPQEQIALMYLDAYDRVLNLCRQTADAPEAQRFKWTCETSWQVRHYVEARPEREAEFLDYVRRGQIEITANYFHFTDLIDADAYRRSLEWVVAYCQRHQLPLRCALHCDINGWPWAVADILAELDIPYFCSQVHIDSATDPLGKRGSLHYGWLVENPAAYREDAPVRVPQAFWWQGPAGGRVLHWLNEHYLLGNMLSVSSNKAFGADKSRYFIETDHTTVDELYQRAQREVPRYVERLRAEGYTRNSLLLSTGGFYVDNAPPDHRWCELIERWNAEHDEIVLRTATLSEWFAQLEREESVSLPTRAVAWPDHWAHGLGSQTAHIAQARRTQRRRAEAIALTSMAASADALAYLDTALEQERLALEHTFDAWSTEARPTAPFNHFQQVAKELTFHRAEMYLDEAVGKSLRHLVPQPGDIPTLYVSTLTQDAGKRVVHFGADDFSLDPARHVLVAPDGQRYPFQRDQEQLSQFVAVLPLTQGGLSGFHLASGESGATQASVEASGSSNALEMRTDAWSLSIDPASGGLRSLRESATDHEWVAPHEYTFGQLVQEVVVHPLGRQAVGNIARIIALNVASEQTRSKFTEGPIVERSVLTVEGAPQLVPGPVFDTIVTRGNAPRIGQVQLAWRCYHALPLVELVIEWHKVWNDLPEAAYVAFPFQVPGGSLSFETGGGFFTPGSHEEGGQLPGTCSSYYTIQRAARIQTPGQEALYWLPLDAPLVMTNTVDYNRWETTPWTWNGFLASMPVNHYWHTNFPTSQRGFLRLRYRFFSARGLAQEEQAIQRAMPLDALGWR